MCIYQEITKRWLTNGKPLKNNRMFFENDKLYSYGYHYVIARIDRERNIVLINNNKSSPTTNRHKEIVRVEAAFSGIGQIYNVPAPSANLECNQQLLREDVQSAIYAANKHMIKPNMQAVETIANDFDALAVYMGATANIMNTKVYTDYLALKDRYNAKRSK